MQASRNHEEDSENRSTRHLLDHAPISLFNKPDQHGHIFALIAFRLELLDGLRRI